VEWIAITGLLPRRPRRQAGELPRLGRQLVRFQTLCRRIRPPIVRWNLSPSLRAAEMGFPPLPLPSIPLKSHFKRTCLFLYFRCPNFVERRFVARTLTCLDVETRFLSLKSLSPVKFIYECVKYLISCAMQCGAK